MKPGDIARRTHAWGAPATWDPARDGICGVLPVRAGTDDRGVYATMTSAWFPDANDIALMQKGLPILLTIFGTLHPVVSVAIGQPSDLVPALPPASDGAATNG